MADQFFVTKAAVGAWVDFVGDQFYVTKAGVGAWLDYVPPHIDIEASQFGVVGILGGADPLDIDIQVSQFYTIAILAPVYIIPTPPAIKLPCQANCLQFFDARK